MEYLIQAALSFVGVACFAVIFNAPNNLIIHCGTVGSIGWMIYYVLTENDLDPVKASFLGAFVVAIGSHALARKFKKPMIVFNVAGIIPLVPGGIAYNAMRSAVENNYLHSIQYGLKAFLVSGAIVMGLVFAEVIMQLMFRVFRSGKLRYMRSADKR